MNTFTALSGNRCSRSKNGSSMNAFNSENVQKKMEGFAGQLTCILPQAKVRFCAQHIFCKNLYITDIGYYPNAAHHERKRPKAVPSISSSIV